MSSGYAKVFARILDSTIWRESDQTRILWITMLAMVDRTGVVHCTIPGLADRARISLAECEHGLERFQQPDKYSWSKEDEGRRIRVVDGGWFLINYDKYRNWMSAEETREKTRIRTAKWRERKNSKSSPRVTPVTNDAGDYIASASAPASKTPLSTRNYTNDDHIEKNLRLIAKAERELADKLKARVGSYEQVTDQQWAESIAETVGITVKRYFELKNLQRA